MHSACVAPGQVPHVQLTPLIDCHHRSTRWTLGGPSGGPRGAMAAMATHDPSALVACPGWGRGSTRVAALLASPPSLPLLCIPRGSVPPTRNALYNLVANRAETADHCSIISLLLQKVALLADVPSVSSVPASGPVPVSPSVSGPLHSRLHCTLVLSKQHRLWHMNMKALSCP